MNYEIFRNKTVRKTLAGWCAFATLATTSAPAWAAVATGDYLGGAANLNGASSGVANYGTQTANYAGFTAAGGTGVLDWNKLNVPGSTTMEFNNGTFYNVVNSAGGMSTIAGAISGTDAANVYIFNPNGVLFNSGSSVNVGGIFGAFATGVSGAALTDWIANPAAIPDFSNAKMTGDITVKGGTFSASQIALAGVNVSVAEGATFNGDVTIAAGDRVTIDGFGGGLITMTVPDAAEEGEVDVLGEFAKNLDLQSALDTTVEGGKLAVGERLTVATKGDPTMFAGSFVANNAEISAKSVEVTARRDVFVQGETFLESTAGNLALEAQTGKAYVRGSADGAAATVSATGGDLTVKAAAGVEISKNSSLSAAKDGSAGGDVALTATGADTGYDPARGIWIEGGLEYGSPDTSVSAEGAVTMTAAKGDLTVKAAVIDAGGDLVLSAAEGAVVADAASKLQIDGKTTLTAAADRNITLEGTENDLAGAVSVTSAKDVKIVNGGDLTLGAATADSLDLRVTDAAGMSVKATGDVTAQKIVAQKADGTAGAVFEQSAGTVTATGADGITAATVRQAGNGTIKADRIAGNVEQTGTGAAKLQANDTAKGLAVTGTLTQDDANATVGTESEAVTVEGTLTQNNGSIKAKTLTLKGGATQGEWAEIGADSVVLKGSGNDYGLTARNNAVKQIGGEGKTVALGDGTGVTELDVAAVKAEKLTLNTVSKIKQSGAIDATELSVNAHDGTNGKDVALDTQDNKIGTAALTGGDVRLKDVDGGLRLGDVEADKLTVAAAGAVSQTEGKAVKVTGATSVTAKDASDVRQDIALANAANDFGGAVAADGATVVLRDANGVVLGDVAASANLRVEAGEDVAVGAGKTVTAARNATLVAGRDVRVDGTLAAERESAYVKAGGDVVLGSGALVSAGGDAAASAEFGNVLVEAVGDIRGADPAAFGTVRAGNGGTAKGAVALDAGGAAGENLVIEAGAVAQKAKGDLTFNLVGDRTVSFASEQGKVTINHRDGTLTVDTAKEQFGDAKVNEVLADGTLLDPPHALGDHAADIRGVTAGSDVEINGDTDGMANSELHVKSSIRAGTYAAAASKNVNVHVDKAITVDGSTADGAVTEKGVFAAGDVTLAADGIEVKGAETGLAADGDIGLTAKAAIAVTDASTLTAGKSVALKAQGAVGDITIDTTKGVTAKGGDVRIANLRGDVLIRNGTVRAIKDQSVLNSGQVEVDASGDVTVDHATVRSDDHMTVGAVGTITAGNGANLSVAGDGKWLSLVGPHVLVKDAGTTLVGEKNDSLVRLVALDPAQPEGTVTVRDGAVITGGGLMLNGQGSVDVLNGAQLTAKGESDAALTVMSTRGGITVDGRSAGAEATFLKATAGGVEIAAGKDLAIREAAVSAARSVDVSALEKVDVTGSANVNAGKSVALTAGSDLTIRDALVSASENLALTADRGDVTAGGRASLSAGQDVKVVAAEGAVTMADQLHVGAGRDVVVAADKDVSFRDGADVFASRDLIVDATAGKLAVRDAAEVSAQSNMRLAAGDDTTVATAVTAGKNLTVIGKNVRQDANLLASDGSVYVEATGGDIVMKAGTVTTAGKAVAGAADGSGNVLYTAKGDVRADAGGATVVADPTFGDGAVALVSETGSVGANMTVKAARAGMDAKGDVTATLAGDVEFAARSQEGSVSVTHEQGTLTVGKGAFGASDKVVKVIGVDKTEDVILRSEVPSDLNGIEAKRDVAVVGRQGSTVVVKEGSVIRAESGDVTVSVDRDIRVDGTVDAKKTAKLAAERNVAVNGQAKAGKDVALTAGDNATVNGQAKAGGDVALAAGDNATVNGSAAAGGDVALAAVGSAAVNGSAAAGNDVTLAAVGSAAVNGSATAGNDVVLTAGGSAAVNGSATAGNDVTLAAGGSAAVNGSAAAGNDVTLAAGGDASVNGSAAAGKDVVLAAGNDATVDGSATGRDVAMTAQRNVGVGGIVGARRDALAQAKYDVAVSGTVRANHDVVTAAGRTVAVSGSLEAGNDQAVVALGNLATPGAGRLVAGRDLSVNVGSSTPQVNVAVGRGISARSGERSIAFRTVGGYAYPEVYGNDSKTAVFIDGRVAGGNAADFSILQGYEQVAAFGNVLLTPVFAYAGNIFPLGGFTDMQNPGAAFVQGNLTSDKGAIEGDPLND